MVASTSLGLVYPTGGDRPCDSWETWVGFAQALEGRLLALDADIGRVGNGRPMAKVSVGDRGEAAQILDPVNDDVLFDTVEVDTAGMVDLARSPYAISIPRDGTWWYQARVQLTGVESWAWLYAFVSSGGASIETGGQQQFNSNWQLYRNSIYVFGNLRVTNAAAGDRAYTLRAFYTGTTGQPLRVVTAEMAFIWMGD